MSILIGVLITFLVVILVLYLVNMLPVDGRAKQIIRIIVIIIGVLSLLRYVGVSFYGPRMAERVPSPIMRANAGTRRPARSWLERRWEARDPTPLEDATPFWRADRAGRHHRDVRPDAGRVPLFGAGVPAAGAVRRRGRHDARPDHRLRRRHGVPAWLSALVVVLAVIGLANVAVITLAKPSSELVGRAPELGNALRDKLHILDQPLAAFAELQAALGGGRLRVRASISARRG